MQLSTGIIWKDTVEARRNESTDLVDIYLSELFITASRGLLNFEVIKAFPRAVLLNAGIPEVIVDIYASDKTKIPYYLRDILVDEYAKALTSKNPMTGNPGYYNSLSGKYELIYNETNDYYRMLMGLPNRNDSDYIYNTDPRWDTKTPIHEMNIVDILEMEEEGILDNLLKKYPTKTYLKYRGRRRIDPFIARIADRFEILYHEESPSATLNEDFINVYNSARRLVSSVYYNHAMNEANSHYENFLAMCILFMTLQGIQSNYLQSDITRDFYDAESLKLVYDSYGVPFYSDIPLEYHRRIVKNINRLISYKGSAQVFFDLFDIFDVGTMDIYSYYLTKTHKFDDSGMPQFTIKTDSDGNELYDDEGNPILDESNYEIKFSRVKMYVDPALSISDDANTVDYSNLTEADPYWIEDAELMKKLSSENFNYLESKYIGVKTVFDLLKITYENAYIFRLITDNKKMTDQMIFRWADVGINCSVFDLFIYLASLYCRYYGYEGILNAKLPAIMDTLGYDFDKTIDLIKSRAILSPTIQSNVRLLQLISNMTINNLSDLNQRYSDINEIRDLIVSGYTNAKTLDEYWLYRDLYDTLLISKEVASVYSDKSTGEVYETFTDLLADTCPELMQRYLVLTDDHVEDEISLAITELEKAITGLKYMSLSAGISTNSMIDSLFRILNFFKSAKAELVSYHIQYAITLRGVNFIKLIDILGDGIETGAYIDENLNINELIHIAKELHGHKTDLQSYSDLIGLPSYKFHMHDYISSLNDILGLTLELVQNVDKDASWYIDLISSTHTARLSSEMPMIDIDPILTALDILEARYSGTVSSDVTASTELINFDYEKNKIYDTEPTSDKLYEKDSTGLLIPIE